jgi:hypothetical protein
MPVHCEAGTEKPGNRCLLRDLRPLVGRKLFSPRLPALLPSEPAVCHGTLLPIPHGWIAVEFSG